MSNRLMWLLIVLAFTLAGIWFYMYSYVSYTGQVVLNTNVENYTVELKNYKTLKAVKKECSEQKCELAEVPPFDYLMKITKEWYKDYEEKISVKRSEIKSIVFALEKDTKLSPLLTSPQGRGITQDESILSPKEGKSPEGHRGLDKKNIILSKKEKLERLRNKKAYYTYFEINNFWEVYFKLENNKMNLYFRDELAKEKRISSFNKKVEKSKIWVQKILWDDSKIFLNYGEKKFLYNAITADFTQISLKIPVKYIKTWIDRNLQFVTKKWTFIYKNKKFEYFSMFEDFVYRDWNYIWVIKSDDLRRKKNLNFDWESGTLVVLQNPQTKEKRVLLKPQFEVGKILIKNDKVVLEDSEGKEFSLENY